jgi:hypothetical protein
MSGAGGWVIADSWLVLGLKFPLEYGIVKVSVIIISKKMFRQKSKNI